LIPKVPAERGADKSEEGAPAPGERVSHIIDSCGVSSGGGVKMEDWKIGRMEGWKDERMEG